VDVQVQDRLRNIFLGFVGFFLIVGVINLMAPLGYAGQKLLWCVQGMVVVADRYPNVTTRVMRGRNWLDCQVQGSHGAAGRTVLFHAAMSIPHYCACMLARNMLLTHLDSAFKSSA
jgi:hypothetical protein